MLKSLQFEHNTKESEFSEYLIHWFLYPFENQNRSYTDIGDSTIRYQCTPSPNDIFHTINTRRTGAGTQLPIPICNLSSRDQFWHTDAHTHTVTKMGIASTDGQSEACFYLHGLLWMDEQGEKIQNCSYKCFWLEQWWGGKTFFFFFPFQIFI